MADVSTYSKARQTYASQYGMIHEGNVRPNTDPAVLANPELWEAITDAELSTEDVILQGDQD